MMYLSWMQLSKAMKWKSNTSDGMIRKLKQAGGRVVTVQPNHTSEKLQHVEATKL